jgi:hypothetical protein
MLRSQSAFEPSAVIKLRLIFFAAARCALSNLVQRAANAVGLSLFIRTHLVQYQDEPNGNGILREMQGEERDEEPAEHHNEEWEEGDDRNL